MWSVEFAQGIASLMLACTVIGASVLLWWSGFLFRKKAVRRANEPGRVVFWAWPVTIVITLFWSVGVLLLPTLFYSPLHLAWFPDAAQWAGGFAYAGGGVMILWATRVMGREMRPKIMVGEGHRLVRSGPYSQIRHPLYTALLLMAAGVAVAFLNPILLVLALLMYAIASARASLEEDLLSSPEGFGEGYRSYMAETGRFLPRLRR